MTNVYLWYSLRAFSSRRDKEHAHQQVVSSVLLPVFVIEHSSISSNVNETTALQPSMEDRPPKPMKKANRNIFKKVGKKLGDFDKRLGLSSPNLAHGSVQSLNTLSDSYYEDEPHRDDTVSLHSMSQQEQESPQEVRRHRKKASTHSTSSHGEFSNASEEYNGKAMIDRCFSKVICLF